VGGEVARLLAQLNQELQRHVAPPAPRVVVANTEGEAAAIEAQPDTGGLTVIVRRLSDGDWRPDDDRQRLFQKYCDRRKN
jgi:hypothetical protein